MPFMTWLALPRQVYLLIAAALVLGQGIVAGLVRGFQASLEKNTFRHLR